MKISDRFLDYGLTGGFFLTVQVILFMHFVPQAWQGISVMTATIPSALDGSINTILAALGIVTIFFTGALLDLFTPFHALAEMYEIRKHLILNNDWLQDAIIKSYTNLNMDLETLCILQKRDGDIDTLNSRKWLQAVVKKRFKSSAERTLPQRVWQGFRDLSWISPEKRELVLTCQKLVAFFHSFIFINCDASQLEILVDRMHLWQTIRAFSTAITILSIEFIIFLWGSIILSLSQEPLQRMGIALFISLILIAIIDRYARRLINKAFSRVCITLFSLVYLVSKKQSEQNCSSNF
ncbi:MAG: hypothetical protein ACRDIV_17170 [Ktedonobacteraceae bacterium]